MNQGESDTDASKAPGSPGILSQEVGEAELERFSWQQEMDVDSPFDRLALSVRLNNRAAELEADAPLHSSVLRLLAAIISMHLRVGTPAIFGPAIQLSSGERSAVPEDLGQHDLFALKAMAKQTSSPWLRSRMSDVGLIVAKALGVPGWELGSMAARAYLEHAKGNEGEHAHAVDRRESLQRAMALGRPYLRNDEEFHAELWSTAMSLMRIGLSQSMPGVSVPIADEIIQRNRGLAAEAARLFESQADALFEAEATPLAADMFRQAGKLWNAADSSVRVQAAHHRAAEVLIALARGSAHAMLQAEWMSEGIAILRRSRGDRTYIRALQAELEEIRSRIVGEMSTVSHSFEVTELLDHVRSRVTSENFPDALLQLAFAFSNWVSPEQARERVIRTAEQYVFSSMFAQVTYDEHGVPVAVMQTFDAANEEEMEKRMIQHIAQFDHPILAQVAIPYAIDLLQMRFEPTVSDLMGLLYDSPVTPRGHEWTLARGILAGLNHDWHEAAVFLIPQAEPLVRAAFKRRGIHTLAANSDGAEEERTLGHLLDHPEVASVLAPDMTLELKTLLTHKSGHNLRNLYGHGLMADDRLPNAGTIVLWWTLLRLILWPYRGRAVELVSQAAGNVERDSASSAMADGSGVSGGLPE